MMGPFPASVTMEPLTVSSRRTPQDRIAWMRYADGELKLLAGFLRDTAGACRGAAEEPDAARE